VTGGEDRAPADRPPDPWARFRAATPARIGLARCGDGLSTSALLDFQLAHAEARDAVHGVVDFDRLAAEIGAERPVLRVHSAARDRAVYLRRPDLGRRLDPDSRARLELARRDEAYDVVFVICDGLSSAAVNDHAIPTLKACLDLIPSWTVAPIVLARQARVALGDEVCVALGARLCAVLIGERPGLSVANSLGVYLTWSPRIGHRDADRNCISNIHGAGLGYDLAARKLAWLMSHARRLGLTGVGLKEDSAPQVTGTATLEGAALPAHSLSKPNAGPARPHGTT
jgi:ethanolamine ammonia-lyase small subunit